MPLVKPYHDDASKARNMCLFADLQRVTVKTIPATVLARLLKLHRQYINNFTKPRPNQKFLDAKQFFVDFEADYAFAPDGTQMWSLSLPDGLPCVYWVEEKATGHAKCEQRLMPS
jgi:hypothetical protein